MLFIHRFKERSKVKVYQLPKPRVMTMAAANDMKHKKADPSHPTASTNAPIKRWILIRKKSNFLIEKRRTEERRILTSMKEMS